MKLHFSERTWMRWLCSSAAVVAIGVVTAFAQSNPGSIQGTVVGSDGTPLPGARVYAAIKALNQKTAAPPTLTSRIQAGAIAGQSTAGSASPGTKVSALGPTSAFLISGLPAGAYILCAQTATPGWLDPCHWSPNVPVINLAAGQNLTAQTVVMPKGAVVQIRLVDPSKMLAAKPGPIPRDVEIIARASNNAYYNAQLASTDAMGQYRVLILPFDQPHTLTVRSQQFSLLDATGAAVPAAGRAQPLQISANAVVPQFTYTVAARAH